MYCYTRKSKKLLLEKPHLRSSSFYFLPKDELQILIVGKLKSKAFFTVIVITQTVVQSTQHYDLLKAELNIHTQNVPTCVVDYVLENF